MGTLVLGGDTLTHTHLVCCTLVAIGNLGRVQPVPQQRLSVAKQLARKREHLGQPGGRHSMHVLVRHSKQMPALTPDN
jgi:hypothetical protein